MTKPSALKSALIAAGLLTLAGHAFADIKLGYSAPLSGPQGVVGQEQLDGLTLGLEQLGNKLGGQSVTLIKEDDQLKPEIASQIMRKFIDQDKVDAIVGLGYSNIVMANLKRLTESGVVSIATTAGPSPMAGEQCAANVFSTAWQNDGFGEAIGKQMMDRGVKNVYMLAPNYQAGKDMLAGVKRYYKNPTSGEVYAAVGQADYSAEITQMQQAKPDALFAFFPGGPGVNFIKQLSQSGAAAKIPVFSTFTVDGANLPAVREAGLGVISGNMWDASLSNAENAKFVKDFTAKFKRPPTAYAAVAYDTVNLLDAAVKKLNGNVSDKKAFATAVHNAGAEFKSVRGPFKFNNNNFPIQNYYAFQLVKEGDNITNKLVATPLPGHMDAYYTACPLK